MPENIILYIRMGNNTRQGTAANAGYTGEFSVVRWLWLPACAEKTQLKNKNFIAGRGML
ncbi:MAG: hypothetical protein JW925_02500 [Syntrophaceae bacterium]|nr:hypothetical protein [Syntrophaceae bacterium]